jgi:hypothetical protein
MIVFSTRCGVGCGVGGGESLRGGALRKDEGRTGLGGRPELCADIQLLFVEPSCWEGEETAGSTRKVQTAVV